MRVRRLFVDGGIGGGGLREQFFDMSGVLGHGVGDELQGGRELDTRLLSHLATDHTRSRGQCCSGRGLLIGISEDRVEDRRLTKIRRDPHIGDGDETQPRILDPQFEHLGDDVLDALG